MAEKLEQLNVFDYVEYGDRDMLASLLQSGLSPNESDKLGKTFLHYSAKRGDRKMAELLLSHGAEVNAKDHYSSTPIHDGATIGCKEIVKLLLSHRADVNAADYWGRTPLFVGADKGHKKIVKLMISHGSEVNKANTAGQTPLHVSALYGYKEIVELLIEYGADIDHPDITGKTPLGLAKRLGHKDIVDILSLAKPDQVGVSKMLNAKMAFKTCLGYKSASRGKKKEAFRNSTETRKQKMGIHGNLEFGRMFGSDKGKVKSPVGRCEAVKQSNTTAKEDDQSLSDLTDFDNRVWTYRDWPANHTHQPVKLAAAGFYHVKEIPASPGDPVCTDCVRCFACKVRISNWQAGDHPFVEHARCYPSCPFINLCKGTTFIIIVKELEKEKKGTQITKEEVMSRMREEEQKRENYGHLSCNQKTVEVLSSKHVKCKKDADGNVKMIQVDSKFSHARRPSSDDNTDEDISENDISR